MKRVLIATIMRDQMPNLSRWHDGIMGLVRALRGQYEVTLAVYENDSTDLTAPNVEGLLDSMHCGGIKSYFTFEQLGTQRYGSVWSLDRLRNLANARQKCIDQVRGDLARFDKIAWVEPDVTYDPNWCAELILARHPLAAGLGEPDIYSGWSLRSKANPKESVYLYDTCATRATRDDTSWDFAGEHDWRPASVIPTDLGGHDAMCLHRVWSTFNCFCVYNAEPFKQGLQWDWANYRLDTGQGPVVGVGGHHGTLEADTVAICEAFRAHGHDKVYLNTNCLIRHA